MSLRHTLRFLALCTLLLPAVAFHQVAGAAAPSRHTPAIDPDLQAVNFAARLPDVGHVRFVRASTDGSLLFVGLSSGALARSADGGRTWRTIRMGIAGSPGAWMLDLQVAPSDKRIVWAAGLSGAYRSADAGLTWSEADTRSDVPARAIGSVLAVDPRHPEAAYLGGYRNGGLYRTGDGGLSWQQVISYPVSGVAIEQSNGSIVYAVSRTAGFQRSNDHGHTWSAGVQLPGYAGVGEETVSPGRLLSVPGPGGGLFAALDGGGLARSLDGGRSWRDVSAGLPHATPGNGYAVPYDLSVTMGAQPRLFAVVPSGTLGAFSGGALFSASIPISTSTSTSTMPLTITTPLTTTTPITGTSAMSGTTAPAVSIWQPVAQSVDAVMALATAPQGLLVAAEQATGGYPAAVSGLGGPVIYDVPYIVPPALARVSTQGFANGATPISYVSGVNYEGPNDRPWQMWQDKKFDASLIARDFDSAAAAGYRVVRIFVQDPLPAQVLAGEFGHFDSVVTLARQRDLRLLITFNDSRDPDLTRVAAVDRAIAAHYAGNPTIFGYDLQNEPAFQDVVGAIYPPGTTLPLLSNAIVKRYGEHVKLSTIHKDRAAGKWRDGVFAHMSELDIYKYLNAASILDDYFSASPSQTSQGPGDYWGPLRQAVNASLSIFLRQQLDAVRSVDRAHLVTVGYNSQFWSAQPANDMLDFRSIHMYPASQDFSSIHSSLQTFESMVANAHSPLILGEYGFSTAFQSSAVASVQETGMSLYLRVLGGAGDFKWQLNDDTVGYNPYENGLGLFGAGNAAKVGFYVNRELAAYFNGPHQPGGVRMWGAGSTGLGYLYSAPDAFGVSGGSYSDARLAYVAHKNAPSAQLWLDWAQPGRLRIVSTHEADLSLDMSALTGAISGTVTLAPDQSFSQNGSRVAVKLQAGIWYSLGYTPGGRPLQPDTLPSPARPDGWYILATGHNVAPPFLTRWLALGGVSLAGAPFSEPLPAPGGAVQYYDSLAMQAHGAGAVLLPLGLKELGGVEDPARELPKKTNHLYFKDTGHNLQGAFLRFWQATGGLAVWGPPIGEERRKAGYTVQYFMNAEFVLDGTSVTLGSVGARAWAQLSQS